MQNVTQREEDIPLIYARMLQQLWVPEEEVPWKVEMMALWGFVLSARYCITMQPPSVLYEPAQSACH